MKTLSAPALTALFSSNPIIAGAVRFDFGTIYRLWSGYGSLTIGADTFEGVGALGLIVPVRSNMGSGVEAVDLTLSGLDPIIAATIEAEDYAQKPCTIWRAIFAGDGVTLLDATVFYRGRVDVVQIREQGGGTSSIVVTVEGAGRDMERKGSRTRCDVDQRLLGGSTDGGMKFKATAPERTLYWGQKPELAPIEGVETGVGGGGGGFREFGFGEFR
jgi:hypothetical protein